jgi:SAM-dependent methyltransferase
MQLDAAELSGFYESALGKAARRAISRRIREFWPHCRGLRVLGYGFAPPYLKSYVTEAERAVALCPARTGVVAWPLTRPLTLLGEEDALPFADAVFDRILVVHGLEGADAARVVLRQLWRVLAPEGRILLVTPNRASLWAQLESSPFACGRPFHRSELAGLLSDTLFEPVRWDRALYLPPFAGRRLASFGTGFEKLGHRFCPGISGVHLVEASKSLYGRAAAKTSTKAKVALRPAATLQS